MSLKISREGRVTRLTLARAEKRNALDESLCAQLVAAFEEPCGCFLLDAEGPVFCAGMDLEAADSQATRIHERLFTVGARLNAPLVCAVGGPALGGGLGLVANSHVAIVAQGAQFGLTEIRIGMWPFVIWPSVVAAIGERRTTMLALTGRLFGSAEAFQWGLAHEVVPPIELDDRATAIATALADSSRTAIKLGLRLAREARTRPLDETVREALILREQAFASEDFAEGRAAFREKRKPNFPSIQ